MEQETPVFTQATGFEQVTVSTTAIGCTTAKIRTNTSTGVTKQDARAILATVEGTAGTNDIRWTCDGTTPTTDVGHVLKAGQSLIVRGLGNITNFRMIRDGASDAIVSITYFN